MRSVGGSVPKALLPVGSRPLLQWCLEEALEAGFREIAVVVRENQPRLAGYVREGGWREGLPRAAEARAAVTRVGTVIQAVPRGVVDAVLSARDWIEDGRPFAVYLPDNVRLDGPPPLTADRLAAASRRDLTLVACHKVRPATSRWFGDVGRAELGVAEPGTGPVEVVRLQRRGSGTFEAPAGGAWRIAPRYIVGRRWLEIAREVAVEAAAAGTETDDVAVHRRLVAEGRLFAVPWRGTMVDAGHPAGYLYAQRLLDRTDEPEGSWRSSTTR